MTGYIMVYVLSANEFSNKSKKPDLNIAGIDNMKTI